MATPDIVAGPGLPYRTQLDNVLFGATLVVRMYSREIIYNDNNDIVGNDTHVGNNRVFIEDIEINITNRFRSVTFLLSVIIASTAVPFPGGLYTFDFSFLWSVSFLLLSFS